MTFHALVVAKAPVAGRVKTRLGASVGAEQAAGLARAALLDTLDACSRAVGPGRCLLALAGALGADEDDAPVVDALTGWEVFAQHGHGLAERLVHAHADARARVLARGDPWEGMVQVGMDTPQITPEHLRGLMDLSGPGRVGLGPTEDGGWWGVAHDDPACLAGLGSVPMSTSATGRLTRDTIGAAGYAVGEGVVLRDVDTLDDARAVAAEAPGSRFAEALSRLHVGTAPERQV